MAAIIKKINRRSPVRAAGVKTGQTLLSINGNIIRDVLDYKFYSYERELILELQDNSGEIYSVKIYKPEGGELGIEFETYLMDKPKSCGNKCVFCFIDQLPEGLRETLYFKDDDARLSFLLGNYITLTNLAGQDIDRIIKMRLSPVNVSVHTINPELRRNMLGNNKAGNIVQLIDRLCHAGIMLNCQIVVCPGFNDGKDLTETLTFLALKYPMINSVSVVPVGLTKYRGGLTPLCEVSSENAAEIIRISEEIGNRCMEEGGSRVIYCADELYLKAGISVPEPEYYEDYPQLLNGVGMLALFNQEFTEALADMKNPVKHKEISVATGEAALPFMKRLIDQMTQKCDNISVNLYGIKNEFFGGGVNVAGLITGFDLIRGLKGRKLGCKLFIPASMLRHEGDLFLDGVSTEELSEILEVPVIPVPVSGAEFMKIIAED